MKKVFSIIVVAITTFLLVYVGYTYMIGSAQDSVISIKQVDANGTLIKTPVVLAGKYKHNYKFDKSISGYQINGEDEMTGAFWRENQNVTLKYNGTESGKLVVELLKHKKYLLSTAQNLDVTSVNGSQAKSNGTSTNRLRLFVSPDSQNWKQLMLNYPNIRLNNPTTFWNGKRLFIYDNNVFLSSTDFSTWNHKSWDTKSAFNLKRTSVFNDRSDNPQLFIKANSSAKETDLFYSSIRKTNGSISKLWKPLSIDGDANDIESLSYVNKQYVMLGNSNGKVLEIYASRGLANTFKLVKKIKFSKFRYTSANIIKKDHKYYLMYTLINRDKGDSYGLRYREISTDFSHVGKEQLLNLPITTRNFSVIEIKG